MKAAIFACAALLMACSDGPEMVLLNKHHRPGPIKCVNTGESQETCIDAVGLIWTCGWSGPAGNEATCINTGKIEAER